MLLKLDLQMFSEDEVLDIESELAAFEAEWQDDEVEDTPTQESEEVPTETEESTDAEETSPQEETVSPNDPDAEKRNRAFADMRRQLDESRKYADFMKRLAEEGGTTPDELLARYEQRQLQAEAQKQNVPVEFLKESRETRNELQQLKENMRAKELDSQIDRVVEKYGANEEAIKATFVEMLESGIDPRVQDNVNFEKFYRAANLESIIQKEVENARQKDLEDKRNRQASASVPNGSSVSPSSGELSDEEFDEMLKAMDIRL